MESKRGFFMAHWVSIMDWGLKTWTVSWYHWFKRLFLFWDVRQRGLICEVHTTQVVVSKILYFYPYLVKWSNLTCAYFQLGGSTTNHQPSANCNAFEIMSSTMQCSSATVFLVPFHSVSQLWRYVSPNLPGGEVSHPVHHACIGAGGPLLYILSRFKLNVGYQRCGHAFVGCGPPPQVSHFFKESIRKLPAPGMPGNPPSVLIRLWNERCHDLNSMEIRSVKDACFLKLVSFYIVIMVPKKRYIQNTTTWRTIDTPSNVLIDKRNIRIYLIQGSIYFLFDLHIYIYVYSTVYTLG